MKKLSVTVLVLLFLMAFALTAQDKKIEFGITGFYSLTQGTLAAESLASDLYSGKWSPWFGDGFDYFSWGANPPDKLDEVIGGEALTPAGGIGFGVRIAYNVNENIQIEGSFDYATKAFKIKDELQTLIDNSFDKSMSLLESAGRSPEGTKETNYTQGKVYFLFLNFIYSFTGSDSMTPYVKAGVGMVKISDGPSFSYDLTQYFWGTSASYQLEVSYPGKSTIGFNLAAGVKMLLGENMGIGFEIRDVIAKYALDQQVTTSFARDASWWGPYDNYGPKVAVTQSGMLHNIMPSVYLFFGF